MDRAFGVGIPVSSEGLAYSVMSERAERIGASTTIRPTWTRNRDGHRQSGGITMSHDHSALIAADDHAIFRQGISHD